MATIDTTNQKVDPTALALSRSIRNAEGGDYNNTSGDASTSAGAYQFNNGKIPLKKGDIPANFKSWATEAGLDPNDFSPTNQDHVAYQRIKNKLDAGQAPSSIAAEWNSGLAHNWENHKGTTTINGKTISYDTPAYVKKVQDFYNTQAQGGYNPTPYSNPSPGSVAPTPATSPSPDPSQDDSLATHLQGRLSDASKAISDASTGKINPVSGVIQTVGAGAGAVGDTVNAAGNFVTGGLLGKAEGLVGKALSAVGNATGISKGISDFSQAHPELSKDISSGIDIASLIPLFKGAGIAKDAVGGLIGKALGRDAESMAAKNITEAASKTIKGRTLLQQNPDALKILSQKEIAPALENGRFTTNAVEDSHTRIGNAIGTIDKTELQPILDKASTVNVADRTPIGTMETGGVPTKGSLLEKALSTAKDSLQDDTPVIKQFDLIRAKYGDYLSLGDLNNAKRLISNKISDTAFGTSDYSALKNVRSVLQQGVEDGANKLGLGNVNAINQKMVALYKAQDLLDTIREKTLKPSKFKSLKKGLIHGALSGAAKGVGMGGAYELYKHTFGASSQ